MGFTNNCYFLLIGDQSSGIPLDTQAKKYPDQSPRRLKESIVAEDKIRDSRNVESGNELSSIRIDRSYPSKRTSDSASTPQSFKCGQLAEQFYQTPGELTKAFLQPFINCNVLLVAIIRILCLMLNGCFEGPSV